MEILYISWDQKMTCMLVNGLTVKEVKYDIKLLVPIWTLQSFKGDSSLKKMS